MKNRLHLGNTPKTVMIVIALCAFISASFFSCKKSDTNNGNGAAQFVGTWTGTSTCGSTASFVFAAGSNGNSLTTSGTIGNTGCVTPIVVTVTASGNNLTIPSQTFTDGCGLSYTISGNGSLSGNTLTMTENVAGAVTASCTFTGTK